MIDRNTHGANRGAAAGRLLLLGEAVPFRLGGVQAGAVAAAP